MTGIIDDLKKKAEALLNTDGGSQDPETRSAHGAGDYDAPRGESNALEQRLVEALRAIYDPEIPVNIYDLGLIYTVDVNEAEGAAYVEMTLTAPGCPVAQTFPGMVESRLHEVPGVEEVTVKLVWDPPWTQDRMSEAARVQLGMF